MLAEPHVDGPHGDTSVPSWGTTLNHKPQLPAPVQAGTPPRASADRPTKSGHLRGTALATTTPDSPDLLTMHK